MHYGIPIPELTYGQAIQEIAAREAEMVKQGLATLCTGASCPAGTLKPHIEPFTTWSPLNFFGIIFCMMVGTASLPHILMRYFTTPSVREARQSVAWSLFFIFLLYFSAPAYAAFSKLEVYTNIIGRDLNEIRPWLFQWGELNLIRICGQPAASLDAVLAACKAVAGHPGVVRFQDFFIDTDVIVLSTPEIAGLPYVISGLVAAGGLAAALSTADGLLLAIANALSHDIYYNMIQKLDQMWRNVVVAIIAVVVVGGIFLFLTGPSPVPLGYPTIGLDGLGWRRVGPGAIPWRWLLLAGLAILVAIVIPFWGKANDVAKRLIVARVLLLLVAVAAAATASTRPSDILAMVGWAFSLAMAGNFPALVMGIWWKRTTTTGAICGMIAGFGLCLFYLVTTRYFPGWGVRYFGMTSLLNPATGAPVISPEVMAKVMASDRALETWTAMAGKNAHPLANRVGWFNLNNINCGLLGMPLGFLVIIVVSLFTKAPSAEMRALIDEIRKPRGRTVLEEKTT
jgi:Na+(H+)/acetate symporter ActP